MKYTLTKKDEYMYILMISNRLQERYAIFEEKDALIRERTSLTRSLTECFADRFLNIDIEEMRFIDLMDDTEKDLFMDLEIGHTYAEFVQFGVVDAFRRIVRRNSLPYEFPELDKKDPMKGWNEECKD